MRFTDIRIGVRINAGYAMLIVLMLVVIVLSGSRIYAIRAETDNILQRDWVAAKATSKIHALAREAATRIASLPSQHQLPSTALPKKPRLKQLQRLRQRKSSSKPCLSPSWKPHPWWKRRRWSKPSP